MNSHIASDKKEFWNKKILGWENKNYHGGPFWGSPIRWRRRLFLNLAKKVLRGASVFEGGCGSGLLLEELFAAGVRSYVGCDISKMGIEEAKLRAAKLGLATRTDFMEVSVFDLSSVKADFSFSLGLWDWLTDQEILQSLKAVNADHIFHSFSERRSSVSQILHRVYVYAAYGHNNVSYTPKYRSTQNVFNIARENGISPAIYRDKRMIFSSFLHNLDFKFEA